jgi:hypothetical protein
MSLLNPRLSRVAAGADAPANRRRRPSTRGVLVAAIAILGVLGTAGSASASHLKGGYLSTAIDSTGHMTIHIKNIERRVGCTTVGQSYGAPLTITAPDGTTQVDASAPVPATRCLGQTIFFEGDVVVDLADPDPNVGFGPSPPPGVYVVSSSNCCRVAGIINSAATSFGLTSHLRFVPGQATASPRYVGTTSTGAAQGFDYRGDVTASDPDGGALTYGLTQKADSNAPFYDAGAPDTNVVTLDGSIAGVAAATTAGWNVGNYFVYKTRAIDDQGDSADQDILVTVTDNKPPAFDPLPDLFAVPAGTAAVVPISATDPDNTVVKNDTVSIDHAALPYWATWISTPGNPATAQLSLNPPVGVAGMFLIALDAADDDPNVTLLDSKVLRVSVMPAPPVPAAEPTATTTASGTTLQFDAVEGATYECSIDDAEWRSCTGTTYVAGMAAGHHTFRVRQTSDVGPGAPLTMGWDVVEEAATVAEPAPAAPAVQGCVSRRQLRLHWRVRRGVKPGRFEVKVNGKHYKWVAAKSRSATVKMAGMPKATLRVRVSTRSRGRTLATTRTYRICATEVERPTMRTMVLNYVSRPTAKPQ